MPFCEQAIPTSSALTASTPDEFEVVVYLLLALALFVGVPVLAWRAQRDDWAPRWALALARWTRSSWMLDALLVPALALAIGVTVVRTSHRSGDCLPPYLALLGGLMSCGGLWLFAWLLYSARRAEESFSLLGRRARWLSVAYAAVGCACQANATLYFAVTFGLVSAPPLVHALGPIVYYTQAPLQFAPLLFALVELGSAGTRRIAWSAIRATLFAAITVCVGLAGVGMDWPLSRAAEVVAAATLILFAAPLVSSTTPGVHDGRGTGYAPPTS